MEDLETLASEGAMSLVEALASDAWSALSDRFAPVIRGHEQRAEAAHRRLVQACDVNLDEVRAAEIAAWTQRLGDLLEDNPAAVNDLRRLLSPPVPHAHVDQHVRQQANPARGASAVQVTAGAHNKIEVGDRRTRSYVFNIPIVGALWPTVVAHPIITTVICVVVAAGGAGAGISLSQGNPSQINDGSVFVMHAGDQIDLSTTPPRVVEFGPDSDASYIPNPLWGESFVLTSHNFAAFTGQGVPSESTCKTLVNKDELQGAKAAPGLVYCFITHTSSIGYLRVIDVTPQQAAVEVTLF